MIKELMLKRHYADVKPLYPCLAQIKYDGICGRTHDGDLLSRPGKMFPNKTLQRLCAHLPHGLDGELMIRNTATGDPEHRSVIGGAAQQIGFPELPDPLQWEFYIFDMWTREGPYNYTHLWEYFSHPGLQVHTVATHVINSKEELDVFYQEAIDAGHEGIIIRNPKALYKPGRATKRGWQLIARKPQYKSTATVVGYKELMINGNPQEVDNFGRAKRSSSQDMKYPGQTLGALILSHPKFGEFSVGTGFSSYERGVYWRQREKLKGKLVTFNYESLSPYNKPLQPVFRCFTGEED